MCECYSGMTCYVISWPYRLSFYPLPAMIRLSGLTSWGTYHISDTHCDFTVLRCDATVKKRLEDLLQAERDRSSMGMSLH